LKFLHEHFEILFRFLLRETSTQKKKKRKKRNLLHRLQFKSDDDKKGWKVPFSYSPKKRSRGKGKARQRKKVSKSETYIYFLVC
jgi:hypothetical protein